MPQEIHNKFKTGETVIVKGIGEGNGREGDFAIVIESEQTLRNQYGAKDSMGDRCEWYCTYTESRKQFWRYRANEIEVYCKNQERGKPVLRKVLTRDKC